MRVRQTRFLDNILAIVVLLAALIGARTAEAQGSPVFALGNRVWFDTDNSGTINGAEVGIDGVTIDLYAAGDLTTVLSSQVTVNGGYYLFNNLDPDDYMVAVAASNFSGLLKGYWSSGTSRTAAGVLTEAPAALANTDLDSDDNGTRQTAGTLSGAVISAVISLGPGTDEPTGETDLDDGNQGQPDTQANMTVDFGFYTITLGTQVWNDLDNSGLLDGSELGYDGVTVELLSGDGSVLLDTATTSSGGLFTFIGLAAGEYLLRLPAVNFNPGGILRDYRSSTGPLPGLAYEPAPDPDIDTTDNDDNGTEANGQLGLGGYIQTRPFSLSPAAQESFDNTTGTTTESRMDFGVNNSPQLDLSITKTDSRSDYVAGGTLHYVIIVTNNGPADATGMTISDVRPPQISSWTWTCAGGTPLAYNCTDDATNPATFTDTLDLPQLASLTYHVTAQVAPDVSGDLTNMVVASPPSGMTDMTPLDNIARDIDTFSEPILAVTKSATPNPVTVGSQLTYSIHVTNTGSADAVNLTVSDTLPSSLIYQSASGSGWSCAQIASVVTCTRPLLAPGAAPPILIKAMVLYATASLTNNVSVSAVNARATATASASTSVQGRVTAQDVLPVPTLVPEGLLLMGLLLAGVTAWRLGSK